MSTHEHLWVCSVCGRPLVAPQDSRVEQATAAPGEKRDVDHHWED